MAASEKASGEKSDPTPSPIRMLDTIDKPASMRSIKKNRPAREILADLREQRESFMTHPSVKKSKDHHPKPPRSPRVSAKKKKSSNRAKLEKQAAKKDVKVVVAPSSSPSPSSPSASPPQSRAQEILGELKEKRSSLSAMLATVALSRAPSWRRSDSSVTGPSTAPTASTTVSWVSSTRDDDSFCYSSSSFDDDDGSIGLEFYIETDSSDGSKDTHEELGNAVGAAVAGILPKALEKAEKSSKKKASGKNKTKKKKKSSPTTKKPKAKLKSKKANKLEKISEEDEVDSTEEVEVVAKSQEPAESKLPTTTTNKEKSKSKAKGKKSKRPKKTLSDDAETDTMVQSALPQEVMPAQDEGIDFEKLEDNRSILRGILDSVSEMREGPLDSVRPSPMLSLPSSHKSSLAGLRNLPSVPSTSHKVGGRSSRSVGSTGFSSLSSLSLSASQNSVSNFSYASVGSTPYLVKRKFRGGRLKKVIAKPADLYVAVLADSSESQQSLSRRGRHSGTRQPPSPLAVPKLEHTPSRKGVTMRADLVESEFLGTSSLSVSSHHRELGPLPSILRESSYTPDSHKNRPVEDIGKESQGLSLLDSASYGSQHPPVNGSRLQKIRKSRSKSKRSNRAALQVKSPAKSEMEMTPVEPEAAGEGTGERRVEIIADVAPVEEVRAEERQPTEELEAEDKLKKLEGLSDPDKVAKKKKKKKASNPAPFEEVTWKCKSPSDNDSRAVSASGMSEISSLTGNSQFCPLVTGPLRRSFTDDASVVGPDSKNDREIGRIDEDIGSRFCGGLYHIAIRSGMSPCEAEV